MKRLFDTYGHLLGRPYDDGNHDCYGLLRDYYAHAYGMELPNYARSADFFADGVDLITQGIIDTDFKAVDVPIARLEPGDALLICVPTTRERQGLCNHLGVFVGNGLFIHHLYGKAACEDSVSGTWGRRILTVLRHPSITEQNRERESAQPVDILSLIPAHVKERFAGVASPVLEPADGASGPDPVRGPDSRTPEREPDPGTNADGAQKPRRTVRRRAGNVAHPSGR